MQKMNASKTNIVLGHNLIVVNGLTHSVGQLGSGSEVFLKILLAWAFSLLTLSGAMIQSESVTECLGTVVEAIQSSSHEQIGTSSPESSHRHNQSNDCHHDGTSCHSSHLGHSAFLLGSSIFVPTTDSVYFRFISQISANAFNLQANLFRPPIG